jgi:hypothetical protein
MRDIVDAIFYILRTGCQRIAAGLYDTSFVLWNVWSHTPWNGNGQ